MFHADFWYLLSIILVFMIFVFLICTGETKEQTRSGKRALSCSFTQECITWLGLGVLYPCLSVYLSVGTEAVTVFYIKGYCGGVPGFFSTVQSEVLVCLLIAVNQWLAPLFAKDIIIRSRKYQ